MRKPFRAFAPPSTPPTAVQACGLAAAATLVGVALTRFTWPLFAGTPFVPLFSAVVVATHWGTGPAGLFALFLAVFGAPFAFPAGGPSPWEPHTLAVFILVAVLANRVLASRNQTASALRASERELRATWEHAALGAALLSRFGYIERINPALERLLGYSGTACVGRPFSAFSDPEEESAERERFIALIGGTDAFYQREQRYRREDGTRLWGRITVSAIRGSDGVATGALAVLEDVSARRQTEIELRASEQQLRQAHKMEAVGRLAAGVAHNFNNLLTVIMGFSELLLNRVQNQPRITADLEEIHRAGDRASQLIRQLLAFSRTHDAMSAHVDLNRALTDLRPMLTRLIREDIQLTVDVASEPVAILIDPHDLEQVIFNLVMNARDALSAGGAIHIDVARERIDAPGSAPRDPSAGANEYVRLQVRDNGIGMTPDVQAHLFEPFFTTKDVGLGTGLGLAFVHGIVRRGGGFVKVDTAPGTGTTIAVYFPEAPASSIDAIAAPSAAPVTAERPGATILLVEDDGAVRGMTAGMLNSAGYRVLAAGTPEEACVLFERHAAGIDLLLTDIVMPQMHGPALAERLLVHRPDLRVLYVSGYSDEMPPGSIATGHSAFLAKPFPPSRLLAIVEELLSTPAL